MSEWIKVSRRRRRFRRRTQRPTLFPHLVFTQTASLGAFCQAAYTLKVLGLRQFASPFDWVVSNEKMLIDCLQNNFRDFLNPKYITNAKDKECKASHVLYGPRTFCHRDPRRLHDFLYLSRCVNRFEELLNNPYEYKLFLQIWNRGHCDFYSIHRVLEQRTCNFLLVVILLIKSANRKIITKLKAQSLLVLELYHCSRNLGFLFSNEDDNQLLFSVLRRFRFGALRMM
jgi:hypothetical protein